MSGKTAKQSRKTKDEQVDSTTGFPKLTEDESREFKEAYDAQQMFHKRWEEQESLLISKTADAISQQFNSKVTDGRLSTIVIERAARVMAHLPTGTVRALTKKNKGLGELMAMFLTKYVQKRDNAQFKHLTKLRMVDMYSQVYGVMPVLYDLVISEKYLGPGCAILKIRSWFPQPGKLSIDDSDHNHVETYVSNSWLKSQMGKGSWNAEVLKYVTDKVDQNGGVSPAQRDHNQQSVRERDELNGTNGGKGEAGQVRVITRYEQGKSGRWKTFFPDYDNVIGRDIESKDGCIPIVLKHHIPLIDSIYGLGAFERGKTLQYAMDSLVAMYFAGMQMSIFPPRIIQKDGVVNSSLNYAPGATWIETAKDSIRNYTVSPDGLNSFQSTYGWLTGSLLNQNGTTDTSQTVQSASDPSAGKTPEALRMQQVRESAADAWDRSMMESFLETLYERMINLAPQTPKPFTFHIFDAEISQLQESGLTDVMDVFDTGKEALVTLSKDKITNAAYKFIIDAGTTVEADKATEHTSLTEVIDKIAENPQLQYYLRNAGKELKFDVLFERWINSGGLSYGDDILVDLPEPEMPQLDAKTKAKLDALPPSKRKLALAQLAGQGGGQQGGQAGAAGSNPMFYPSKKMIENINYDDLPLWAQVQMLPMAGIQIPPAVQQMAAAQGQNPPKPVDPNAPTPTAPDPTKDPGHDLIKQYFDRFPIAAQRKIVASIVGPDAAVGMFPVEAEMIKDLSQPSKTDEQGIKEDRAEIEIDPNSPYGAAVDPHAHLQASTDPQVQATYQAIMAHAPQQQLPATAGAPQAPAPSPALAGAGV